RNEASRAMHRLRPDTYPSPDSLARALPEPEIDADFIADRSLELLRRRAPHVRRLLFVVDEVGQYVARDVRRMFDLMGLAHAVQKKRSQIWLVVTSQEKLQDVVESLEGTRIELARVQDRFPITVDIVPSDIEEVVSRRLLDKNAEGAEAVRYLLRAHRNQLLENIRLDSPTRQRDYPEEAYVRLYPLLPYQVELFIDAVSAHRARGGTGPQFGGSNRTLIKLTQQLLVHQSSNLAERDVGALATIDLAYNLLDSIIPTSWQDEINRVAGRHGADALPTRVAKAVALLADVRGLSLTAENLAAALHPWVGSETLRPHVGEALRLLAREETVRQTDGGYKLQSPEEKSWERERRGIDLKPSVEFQLQRKVLTDLLGGVAVEERRVFRVQVKLGDTPLSDGDLVVVLEELDRPEFEQARQRSRDKQDWVFWAFEVSNETHSWAVELHRSQEMIRRHQDAARSREESVLLGEEQRRQENHEKLLRQCLERDLLRGEIYFRGSGEEPRGSDAKTALRAALAAKIPQIYPRLVRFAASAKRTDPVTLLQSDSLEGLPAYLFDLGVLQATPAGVALAYDRDPLASVLSVIRERASYGEEATGKYLEAHFGDPPYGAPVEVLQVLTAALLRAGLIEVVHQGVRFANPRDSRLEKLFGTLPGFRAAAFVPQREVDPDMRARAAGRLQAWTGNRPPLATDQLASHLKEAFRAYREPCTRVSATLSGIGLPVPDAVMRALDFVRGFEEASHEDVIKTCDETWADLVEGCRTAGRLAELLDEHRTELLRRALRMSRTPVADFGEGADEKLARLTDLLAGQDLQEHLGVIESLTAELERSREDVWREAARALNEEVELATARLQTSWAGRVEEAALQAALGPLEALRVDPATGPDRGPGVEVLRARLAGLEAQVGAAEARLAELASAARLVQVRIRDLYDGIVTSPEDLEALLERIRQAAEQAMAEGRHFRLL
ncbi:MAG: BREX system P-loop protein BrxC, partial [Anaerolineae bacterium]|nr:BREX system P-loop protein BrxC [Anaerolineae bacterium]